MGDFNFNSRRSPVVCRKACVATSQPLATSIGIDMLRRGGNAADAAVAIAAALAVTEPCSTGLGGDVFCLYYQKSDQKVYAVNGSGKSPNALSLDAIADLEDSDFKVSAHAVTVPGAARAYQDIVDTFGSGRFSLREILEPAAQIAEEGFPVSPVTAFHWKEDLAEVAKWVTGDEDIPMTVDGQLPPQAGEVFTNSGMARVLRDLGDNGAAKGFYEGLTGQAIVDSIQKHGGVMTMEDLKNHESLFPNPIATDYRGIHLWQVPPNGQGVAALIALSGLQQLEEAGTIPKIAPDNIGSADVLHAEVEMMRLGFSDAKSHVASPSHMKVTNEWLLDQERIGDRAKKLFDPKEATIHGVSLASSCTVSFQVVDQEGNAMSFVNSNYLGFGTGIAPKGCGFTLQNRGAGFSRNDPSHANALEGGKRPYHTIIPGMLTHADTGELYATLSNMGGYQQPQGHVQLTVALVAGELDPQAAVDAPRFCIADGTQEGIVHFEEGIEEDVIKDLEQRGHFMKANISGHDRSLFGRAQIIKRDRKSGVLWAGSDGRADGCAIGF